MRPDEQTAIAAVTAAQHVLADAGQHLDPRTVAAALAAADTATSEPLRTTDPTQVPVTGPVAGGYGRCVAIARDTAATFAAAAETYLGATGAKHYVEQHVTGRDGTRYVITFRRPDGRSPDELLTTAQASLNRLIAAVLHLADQLDIGIRQVK